MIRLIIDYVVTGIPLATVDDLSHGDHIILHHDGRNAFEEKATVLDIGLDFLFFIDGWVDDPAVYGHTIKRRYLSDAGLVPYDGGVWNQTNWVEIV